MYTQQETIKLNLFLKRIVVKEYLGIIPTHIVVRKVKGSIFLLILLSDEEYDVGRCLNYRDYTESLCHSYGLENTSVVIDFLNFNISNECDYVMYPDFTTEGELKIID